MISTTSDDVLGHIMTWLNHHEWAKLLCTCKKLYSLPERNSIVQRTIKRWKRELPFLFTRFFASVTSNNLRSLCVQYATRMFSYSVENIKIGLQSDYCTITTKQSAQLLAPLLTTMNELVYPCCVSSFYMEAAVDFDGGVIKQSSYVKLNFVTKEDGEHHSCSFDYDGKSQFQGMVLVPPLPIEDMNTLTDYFVKGGTLVGNQLRVQNVTTRHPMYIWSHAFTYIPPRLYEISDFLALLISRMGPFRYKITAILKNDEICTQEIVKYRGKVRYFTVANYSMEMLTSLPIWKV